jgi:hypothetical protein
MKSCSGFIIKAYRPMLASLLVGLALTCSLSAQSSWTQLSPSAPLPNSRFATTPVYNPASNRLIIFGGPAGQGNNSTSDVWVLTNANGVGTPTWIQLFPNGAPGPPISRSQNSAVYDVANNRMTIFGGYSPFGTELNDVWVLTNADGTGGTPAWINLSPTGVVPGRINHGAVYDPASNRMMVFLGDTSNRFLNNNSDVWVLTNANGLGGTPAWIQLAPSGTPPAGRWVNQIDSAYDPGTNRLILYGGSAGKPNDRFAFGDTWVLTNANGLTGTPVWQQLNPTGSLPLARGGASGFYDSSSNRLVIYGGAVDLGLSPTLADTWVLSNANGVGTAVWQQVLPQGTQIPPRRYHGTVYDKLRNLMIVYGGQVTGFASVSETWVLSNANGIGNTQLRLDTLTPNHGGNAGTSTVRLTGSGFQAGAAVKLTGLGQDILGANTQWFDLGFLSTSFDLTGAMPGVRSVVITNPDSTSVTLAGAFTVEPGGDPDVWVDIVGRDKIRVGTQQSFYVAYGNRGTRDAFDVLLFVTIPAGVGYSIDGSLIAGFPPPVGIAATSGVQTAFGTVIPLWIYSIPAGASSSVHLVLTSPSDAFIQVELVPPVKDSEFSRAGDFSHVPPNLDSFLRQIAVQIVHAESGGAISGSRLLSIPFGHTRASATSTSICADLPDEVGCYQDTLREVLPELRSLLNPYLIGGGITLGIAGAGLVVIGVEAGGGTLLLSGAILLATEGAVAIWHLSEASFISYKLRRNLPGVSALDPNDKFGPVGVGSPKYVPGAVPISYTIYFDNQPTASAPAQATTVSDALDSNVDLTSLALGPMTFPNQAIAPPSIPLSVVPFSTTVDLRPTTNLLVKITASVNTTTRNLTWTFQSLDPATMQPPTDPLAGFLPPGAEGSVFFSVMPKSTVTTGTVIQNTATVVFDVNAPINTPTWSNTIDNTKPASHVNLLAATQPTTFSVSWTGSDVGAGGQDFTVYSSDNGGSFTPWQQNVTASSALFSGIVGHTYRFYSIARDLVGNVETSKTIAEATTTIAAPSTVQCTGCYFLINGVRATLAFNASVVGTASTFTYNYRSGAQIVQFASTNTSQVAVNGNTATFSGQGNLNGQTGYNFAIAAKDGGGVGSGLDTVSILITGPNNYSYSATGSIVGGDVVVKQ